MHAFSSRIKPKVTFHLGHKLLNIRVKEQGKHLFKYIDINSCFPNGKMTKMMIERI